MSVRRFAYQQSPPSPGPGRHAGIAVMLAGLVTATEYVFRHYVMFWMPTLGTLNVNDMVALALAYSLLIVTVGSLTRVHWRQELPILWRAMRAFTTEWTYTPWILGIMLSLVVVPFVDRWLFAGLHPPMWVSTYRNSATWFTPAAAPLNALAVVGVNGIFVPICEEYLWRGLIQARLQRVMPAAGAVGITAILFSLKHVLVDASWGRFLTVTAFGSICGIVALRRTWRGSAALHLFVNTVTTVVGLAVGR